MSTIFILLLLVLPLALGSPSPNQERFSKEALMAHNIYRRIHAAEPLRLNANLSKLAVKRAQELATMGQLNVKQNFHDGVNLGETVGSISGFNEYNGSDLFFSLVF